MDYKNQNLELIRNLYSRNKKYRLGQSQKKLFRQILYDKERFSLIEKYQEA